MCLQRAPEKYITGAALDRAALVSITSELSGFIILIDLNDKREYNYYQLPLQDINVFHSNLGQKSGLRRFTRVRDPEERILS
jgi:hypothetical protein